MTKSEGCGLQTFMRTIIFTIYLSVFSHLTLASDLSGLWTRTTGERDQNPVQFILIDGAWRFTSQERFIFEDGRLSHTIDQSVKIQQTNTDFLQGTVDFYDSRGCSFKNLTVKAEFQNADLVNILMTVPRYKYVTISAGPSRSYDRPIYCWYHGYPYRYRYICGYEPAPRSVTTECRLLEYVEVPVQLERIR